MATSSYNVSDYDIVVLSHLRWGFVFQRPQHLLTRLAKKRRVIFIEEPKHDASGPEHWEKHVVENGVVVCALHSPIAQDGYTDEQLDLLRQQIPELLKQENVEHYAAWFYTPMAFPLIDALRPEAVVYDCMDELSAFMHAPRELLDRETALLQRADVVFTGGPSLFKAKKDRHPNVHCFSSSVETAHFAQARDGAIEPAVQAALPHPRFGFYGVIDERMDLNLLDAVAAAHPEWQLVMVGPVVKIDPNTLPKHANIHYFGQCGYKDLPGFLAGWDVCLLPFARNASTKFISPTKTLEYMAAQKPIVSTPITDVAEPYGHIVYLGSTPAEFIAACEKALGADDDERSRRATDMNKVLSKTSWDRTASAMQKLIEQAVTNNKAAEARNNGETMGAAGSTAQLSLKNADDAATRRRETDVLIIGAGPTGLSAAYHLGDDALVLDQNERVGGWCRSIVDKGFTFDFAGHIMFSNDPYVHQMYKMLLGDNVHWQNREAWIYSKNVYTRYPFQGALYGLPADVIKECIVGAIEARFGSLKNNPDAAPAKAAAGGMASSTPTGANGNGHAAVNGQSNGGGISACNGVAISAGSNRSGLGTPSLHLAGSGTANSGDRPSPKNLANLTAAASRLTLTSTPKASDAATDGDAGGKAHRVKDCCADGVLEASAKLGHPEKTAPAAAEKPRNFEEFIYKVWGAGIAKHFAIPYNRKLWAVPLTEMETSWLGGRVPLPDLEEMIAGSLSPVGKPMGPNARFGYPLKGGFQALMDGFLPHVQDRLLMKTRVVGVSPSRRTATLSDGTEVAYTHLVSTMPLPVLIRSMGDEAPEEVRQAAAALKYISVKCVNIGVGRENLTDKHWIYYPEDSIFHRIFVQGNASPHCNAPGGFGLTCEITYSPTYKPLPCDGEALIQRCIADCHKVGFFKPEDPIITANIVDMPFAYVVYDHERPANIRVIRDWLATQNIVLAGRYSEWEYYNSDHAFLAGKKVAEKVRELQAAATEVKAEAV